MRRSVFLPLLLTPTLLVGCQGRLLMPGVAAIGNPPYAQDFAFEGAYTSITFETESAAEAIRAQVRSVQFIVGTKTLVASPNPDPHIPSSYYWTTTNPCRDLPQGENLPLKYEMRNAGNEVLQQASVTVDIQTCR